MKSGVDASAGGWLARLLVPAMVALAGCGGGEHPDARLAALPIDAGSVTVSGLSAGGYMAVQFHIAHSSLVHGAGVIAAGPYLCAEDSMRHALGRCMKGDEEIPTSRLLEITSHLALDGTIDAIAGLADDRVWIFHGAADPVVRKPVADALEAYYQALVDPANIVRVEHPKAGHTFPTRSDSAAACEATASPFIGNCGLDGARALLEHLYGDLRDGRPPQDAELVEFDQRPYSAISGSDGLAERGWIFIPATCAAGGAAHCRLHVVFHGCEQGRSSIGDQFVRGSGYLELAAANDLVLLFPQIEPSYQPLNPKGCWDWWGYEGDTYAVKAGPQMIAVRRMVGDVLGEPAS